MKIPKKIMQTWKTTELPEHWKASKESVLAKMKGWEYTLMTDKANREFVQKHFPQYLYTYDNFPHPIQRVDMIRPMWLYVNGGVYMDLDYVIQRSFEDLFVSDSELYFVRSNNSPSYITNSFMASAPRNPFWLEYLEYMTQPPGFFVWGKNFQVMTTTGPMALTRVLKETKQPFMLIPQPLLIPCDVCNIGSCTDEGYMKSIQGQSWNGWDSKVLVFMYCNRYYLRILLGFILCFIVLYFILRKREIPLCRLSTESHY